MEVFREMLLWMDPVARSGPEAMAVDEWLLDTCTKPILRVYRWSGDWASIGYFGKMADASRAFPGVSVVRRWSGGGMVDHRRDWTYSVISPKDEPLANWRGAESYRRIHLALVDALTAEGVSARLSSGDDETGAGLCFENPVSYDVMGNGGIKLAGAGQRRSRFGLLHQGSVVLQCVDDKCYYERSSELSRRLASQYLPVDMTVDEDDLSVRIAARYGNQAWSERR